jgi:hypothetical protein
VKKVVLTTKKRYRKGAGAVHFLVFSADSDQQTLSTSAKLTVKPLKKPKKNKRR